MKYLILMTVFMSFQSRADFFFVKNGKIYLIDSKYSPEKTTVEKARFLKIGIKQDLKNGTQSYSNAGISSLSEITLLKGPEAPKVVASEGCSQNPMTWLKSSKLLGELKKKESEIYIQIAPEVASMGKTNTKCSISERFSEAPLQFSAGEKEFNILICSDDLNDYLLLMKANAAQADLALTENCP